MKNDGSKEKNIPTIRDLYPHLNEEEIKEVEETLDQYLELSVRIYRRIKADPAAYAKFKALTAEWEKTRMEVQRSNNSPKPDN